MKTKIKNLTTALFTFTILASSAALAAPMPGTATSKLVSPKLGIYRSPIGFEVETGTSGWVHTEAPKNSKFVATMYKAPGANKTASLTVRIDDLGKTMTLDKYVQRWKKEYPKYGFDVLASQAFSQNNQKGYVLDLINRESKKQLRQVLFLKNKHAVILTCRDQADTFKDSLKGCNQIIRTFKWTE